MQCDAYLAVQLFVVRESQCNIPPDEDHISKISFKINII